MGAWGKCHRGPSPSPGPPGLPQLHLVSGSEGEAARVCGPTAVGCTPGVRGDRSPLSLLEPRVCSVFFTGARPGPLLHCSHRHACVTTAHRAQQTRHGPETRNTCPLASAGPGGEKAGNHRVDPRAASPPRPLDSASAFGWGESTLRDLLPDAGVEFNPSQRLPAQPHTGTGGFGGVRIQL